LTFVFRDKRILYVAAIAVFAGAEVFAAGFTEAKYDMNIWLQTGYWMTHGVNIYVPPNHLGYPPLWAIWCSVAYGVLGLAGNNVEVWRLTIKLPMILAQFALAFVMWKFARQRFDDKTASKVFWFTLTCSFFVYIGAMWGQINIISALLTFLAFYAVTKNHTGIGAILLGLAITLKIYPLITIPAFLVYVFKNRNPKETGKFALYACAVPVLFTTTFFAVTGWDIIYFLRTIFYWTPAFEINPAQIQGGCMNVWSFAGLNGVDISQIWPLRFLWVPILAAAAVFWFRKRRMIEADLNLALISFYLLFMMSYGWVTEQTFLDPLPFIFLQILAYRPKRAFLVGLIAIQLLVYSFSLFNGGPMIFEPLFSAFYPAPISQVTSLSTVNSEFAWIIRGTLGLAISVALGLYLLFLAEPDFASKAREKLREGYEKVSAGLADRRAAIRELRCS
jgi:hypothetical protein